MVNEAEVREMLNRVFEEEALIIGGLVALYDVSDDIVFKLMDGLDAVRDKALRRLERGRAKENGVRSRPDFTPHPAIEEFLEKVRAV